MKVNRGVALNIMRLGCTRDESFVVATQILRRGWIRGGVVR